MLLALVLLALAPSASCPGATGPGATGPAGISRLEGRGLYGRAVERALVREQAQLVGALDLWVDHSRWEDPWVAASENFEVRTTASYALAADIAQNLEYLRGEWEKLLGAGSPPTRKRAVWIFPNLDAYNAFRSSAAEHSSMYGSDYAGEHAEQPVATYFSPNRTLLGMWVTHGAVHQFLDQSFATRPPTWISEGLASYFALHWDWTFGATELERLVSSPSFVPLERLARDPLEAYSGNADARFVELGMLFHFLLNHCEETRIGAEGDPDTGPFRDYLRAAVRGQDVSGSAFAEMLEEAADLIESDFKSFDFGE